VPPVTAQGTLDVRMQEEALLEAGGAMLSDELDLDSGGTRS